MASKFWPMKRGHVVTSGFGARWGTTHWGADFGWDGGSGGLPVFAVQGGTVVMVGPATGFGQWVVVDHPAEDGGGTTVYGHVIPEVQKGQRVEAGQRIARINPDSNTNGGVAPHLHLEWHRYVWSQPGSDRLDPMTKLDGAAYPGESPASTPAPTVPAAPGLTAEVLSESMGGSLPIDRYRELLPAFNDAMLAAGCTTVERAAMWCAQIGHESVGLRYMEEIADGSAYNGRADLGNTQPGDGPRYKGSGPIQLTGRSNFRRFSEWCHSQGLVDSPRFFEDRPEFVRQDPKWGFLAATWYWVVARPQINDLADARDIVGVTRAINGGTNGLPDRQLRYQRCLNLGAALLPAHVKGEGFTMAEADRVIEFIKTFVAPIGSDVKDIRHELVGDRDNPVYPELQRDFTGHPSLYDLRAGKADPFRGTVTRYIQELDAKNEALVQIVAAMAGEVSKLSEKIDRLGGKA